MATGYLPLLQQQKARREATPSALRQQYLHRVVARAALAGEWIILPTRRGRPRRVRVAQLMARSVPSATLGWTVRGLPVVSEPERSPDWYTSHRTPCQTTASGVSKLVGGGYRARPKGVPQDVFDQTRCPQQTRDTVIRLAAVGRQAVADMERSAAAEDTMSRGSRNEERTAARIELQDTPDTVHFASSIMFAHPSLPLYATPDGMLLAETARWAPHLLSARWQVGGVTGVQIKNRRQKAHWKSGRSLIAYTGEGIQVYVEQSVARFATTDVDGPAASKEVPGSMFAIHYLPPAPGEPAQPRRYIPATRAALHKRVRRQYGGFTEQDWEVRQHTAEVEDLLAAQGVEQRKHDNATENIVYLWHASNAPYCVHMLQSVHALLTCAAWLRAEWVKEPEVAGFARHVHAVYPLPTYPRPVRMDSGCRGSHCPHAPALYVPGQKRPRASATHDHTEGEGEGEGGGDKKEEEQEGWRLPPQHLKCFEAPPLVGQHAARTGQTGPAGKRIAPSRIRCSVQHAGGGYSTLLGGCCLAAARHGVATGTAQTCRQHSSRLARLWLASSRAGAAYEPSVRKRHLLQTAIDLRMKRWSRLQKTPSNH